MSELTSDEISQKILEIVKIEQPETVLNLVELANHKLGIDKDTI